MTKNEAYLGDGVYADFDGYHIVLRCDCMSEPNKMFLDPSSMEMLNVFYARMHSKQNSKPSKQETIDESSC